MKWFKWPKKNSPRVTDGQENFLLVTWDSCRYDAYEKARTPSLDRFCRPHRAWAMATYTLPAHISMFQGFLPHVTEQEPLYNRFCQQLWRISHRNIENTPLVTFPHGTRNIVAGFRERGYLTAGTGAMPFFKNQSILVDGFERFSYTGTAARKQNEFLIDAVRRDPRPWFMFVNYGETHSPFQHEDMPALPGVAERFSRRRLFNQGGVLRDEWSFDAEAFDQQVACAEFLDARTGELLDFLAEQGRPTTLVVCADHGECFGENGFFGHALYHEKVMEVPMLIFRLNEAEHRQLAA